MGIKRKTDDMNKNALGSLIRQKRLIMGFTQTELAHKVGISPSQMCRIEKGTVIPSCNLLAAIARPLDIDEQQILVCAACTVLDKPVLNDDIINEIVHALKISVSQQKVCLDYNVTR